MGLHEHECRGPDCGYCSPEVHDNLVHHRRLKIYPVPVVIAIFVAIAIAWRLVF